MYSPIVLSASLTLDTRHTEAPLVLAAAAGLTVTLPPATGSGYRYNFIVGTTVTSNNYIIRVAPGTNVMAGIVSVVTDVGGLVIPTAAASDTITMNGTTTGGLIGSQVSLEDVAAGVWSVTGDLISTGDEATPFSATVT